MQLHGSKYFGNLELKPEVAHDPHCFQMTLMKLFRILNK